MDTTNQAGFRRSWTQFSIVTLMICVSCAGAGFGLIARHVRYRRVEAALATIRSTHVAMSCEVDREAPFVASTSRERSPTVEHVFSGEKVIRAVEFSDDKPVDRALLALKEIGTVRHIDLSGSPVDDFRNIPSLEELETLHVYLTENPRPEQKIEAISACRSLRHLKLGRMPWKYDWNKHRDHNNTEGNEILPLGVLEQLRNLESLEITGCSDEAIAEIATLPKLRSLGIRRCAASNLQQLRSLAPRLRSLRIESWQGSGDFHFIYELSHLQEIALSESLPYRPGATLPHLRELSCRRVDSPRCFEAFAQLQTLNLDEADAVTIDGLRQLKRLVNFTIDGYSHDNLDFVRQVKSLKELAISTTTSGERTFDVRALSHHPSMETFCLSTASIVRDVEALATVANIQSIAISGPGILCDLSAFSKHVTLKRLDLAGSVVDGMDKFVAGPAMVEIRLPPSVSIDQLTSLKNRNPGVRFD